MSQLRPARTRTASLFFALLSAASLAQAAEPASGTLTDTSGPLNVVAGPFVVANATPVPLIDVGPWCLDPLFDCDSFALTVSLPAGYTAAHPGEQIKITMGWPAGVADYDLYAYTGDVDSLDGTQAGDYASATGANPETVFIPLVDGDSRYTLKIVPYTPTGESVDLRIELSTPAGNDGGTAPASGLPPRFKVNMSPPGLGNSAGEPSIGYNLNSRNAMFVASLQTLRVTFPENTGLTDDAGDALPQSCDAQWVDRSGTTTSLTTLDPILFTEPESGRTFVSQLTGANSLFEYTDDDGDSYIPGQIGPPNGGVDHQTVGAGPYPEGSPFAELAAVAGVDYAVYYCSQSIAAAFCARSDTGGATFGPGVPIYTLDECGGLHGHVKVAPDGTVYVPNKGCGANQAVAVSEDAGNTWEVRKIPTSTPTSTDPSVGIASDGTLYFCYIAADGHPRAAVSSDRGRTWSNDTDLGAALGIEQAVFAQATAGDPERGACAFVGTATNGNSEALDFEGIWHGYVAMTYDAGASWHTVNVTPNDPIQGVGGICTSGTTCGSNRNLLDFNDLTHDERGRVLFAYADGCIGECVNDPVNANGFAAKGAIVRQSGGRTLFAAQDPTEPATPAAACLGGSRDARQANLEWLTPDDGGDAISGYRIYRATSPDTFGSTPIATTGPRNGYQDDSTAADVAAYYYRVTAFNAQGDGIHSNTLKLEIDAAAVEDRCSTPGLTLLTDAANDGMFGTGNDDLLSLQVSQPYAEDGSPRIVFQMTVGDLGSLLPNAYYYASFMAPDGQIHGVRMLVDALGTSATFESYVASENSGGTVDGRFVAAGSEQAADAASGYTADGVISIVVDPANIGLSAADTALTQFNAAIIQPVSLVVGSVASSLDEMPDGLARSGSFEFKANAFCAPNTPPVAALDADTQAGAAPLTVQFSGAASTDADAGDSVASYRFDFGDGSATVTQTGSTISHSYADAGNYRATLRVTDSRGLVSDNTAERVIEVSATAVNNAPRPELTATPSSGTAPLNVTFDGSASSDPDGDAIDSYTFDFGDGSSPITQSAAAASHSYAAAGVYTATLSVTDDQGLQSELVATAKITVTSADSNQAPQAALTATPTSGTAPLTVTLSGAGSSDADGDAISSYIFDFGDDTAVAESGSASVSHTYTAAGTYTARLTVVDARGATSTSPATVTITVSASGGGSGTSGGGGGGALGWPLLLVLAGAALRRAISARSRVLK